MKEKPKSTVKRFLYSIGREIILPIALALIVIQYVIQAFQIPSGSMEDSLLIGDFLLGLKFVYGSPVPFSNSKFPALSAPERGDVVIFRYPGEPEYPDYDSKRYTHLFNALMLGNFYWDLAPVNGNPHLVHYADGPKDFIKRCVAVSGDTVEVRRGVLYLNGIRQDTLPGHGKYTAFVRTLSVRDSLPPLQVPRMGDTLFLDSMSLLDLWRVRSLMVQENPENRIEFELTLKINGTDAEEFVFEKFEVQSGIPGETLTVSVPFKYFSTRARTGFLPLLDPNAHYSGFIRPVSYASFEGSQLLDLESNITRLNELSNIQENAEDSLAYALHYELSKRILIDQKEVHSYVVKEPVYFMMGDNRDNSADSRFWGFVSNRNIKAKAFVIYFSFDNSDKSFSFSNPFSWLTIPFKIRYSRIGKIIPLI